MLRIKAAGSFAERNPCGAGSAGWEAVAVADEAVAEDCDVLMPRGPTVPDEIVFGEAVCDMLPTSARIARSPP